MESVVTYMGAIFRKSNRCGVMDITILGYLDYPVEFTSGGPGNYIPKAVPIQVPWEADEIFSRGYNYIIFRRGEEYYGLGCIPWGDYPHKDDTTPVFGNSALSSIKIPISNIQKVYMFFSFIWVCTDKECYVVGDNSRGLLGIDSNEKNISEFRKVKWMSKNVIELNEFSLQIKMMNNRWYGLGLYDGGNHGFSDQELVNTAITRLKERIPVRHPSNVRRREQAAALDANDDYDDYDDDYDNYDDQNFNITYPFLLKNIGGESDEDWLDVFTYICEKCKLGWCFAFDVTYISREGWKRVGSKVKTNIALCKDCRREHKTDQKLLK